MTIKEKSKIYNDGLEQGIRLQKEKQMHKFRVVLFNIIVNLDEEELEILYKALEYWYLEKKKAIAQTDKGDKQ